MKVVEFRGGLGNQLFEYAYYLYLISKYPKEKIYGFYPSRELWCHQGLEIQKRFEVEMPQSSSFSRFVSWIIFTFNRKRYLRGIVRLSGLVSDDTNENESALLFEGYWQNKKYFSIDFRFDYKEKGINNKTRLLLSVFKDSIEIPVSVHIRRGDYLTCDCPQDYSGICTPKYYEKALVHVKENVVNPHFYFFSDDPEFVKANFILPNMTIVDWNKGEDSWQDMFLMSHCQVMILANSTFSFWAAQNNNNNPLVLCPNRWNNKSNPDLTMPGWIEIPSI